jgi:hypothetical protein
VNLTTNQIYDFINLHTSIETKTSIKHSKDIDLCYEGIDLFLYIANILNGIKFDYSSPELAAQSLLWRYIVSIPCTAFMCLRSAIQGEYRISYSLLRILIEETVSTRYYAKNPKNAHKELRDTFISGFLRETKFSNKLKELDGRSNDSLKKLYDAISKGASHANALEFPGDLIDKKSRRLRKPKEPAYNEESLIWIINTIMRLICISLGASIETYPDLQRNDDFTTQSIHFCKNVESRLL